MKINVSNINFNGFRNIITYDASSPISNAYLLVAQLDDKGKEDLSTFRKLRGLESDFLTNKNDDVLVAMYMRVKKFEKFFLNGKILPCCDMLNMMKDSLSNQEFLKREAAAMRAFTFLCNLTQRISDTALISNDNNMRFAYVIENALKHLEPCFKNKEAAYSLLEAGILADSNHQKIAEKINTAITNSMKRYFL